MTLDEARSLRSLRAKARRRLPAAGTRTLRRACKMLGTQAAVARRLRTTQSRVSAILAGRETISVDMYIRLCQIADA